MSPDSLGPIRAAILDLRRRMPSIRAATVTSVGPIRIQMDGETSPVAATPTTLVPVGPGDRVRVAHYGTTHLILGRVVTAGIPYRMAAGVAQVDFNNDSTASTTFSLPANRFTVTPIVSAAIITATYTINVTGERATSPTVGEIRLRRTDGTPWTGTINLRWTAVQMTPTSAEG